MIGQIIELHSNACCAEADGAVYRLCARGKLRREGGVLVGDFVEFSGGAVERVLPRKNRFIRPNVANADLIVAVVSPVPEPDFLMLDKLCAAAAREGADVIFAVNKSDLGDDIYRKVAAEYSAVGRALSVSAADGEGLSKLGSLLVGKFAVLAGQSAAGKSSLLNALLGENVRTGEVSGIGRGRHTTTYTKIYAGGGLRLADTPGFAVLEADIPAEELAACYPEFAAARCKFRDCTHTGEQGCGVAELVGRGEISPARYARYAAIYAELRNKRKF